MTANTHTAATPHAPLIVHVGHARRPLRVASQSFRHLIRLGASHCVKEHNRRMRHRRQNSAQDQSLHRLYVQALICALTTPVDGECWTGTAVYRANSLNVKHRDECAALWNRLRESCGKGAEHDVEPLCAKRVARLWRINEASQNCSFTSLCEAVADLEVTFELQASLAQSSVCTAVALAQQPSKAVLVRTPIPWRDTDPPLIVGKDGAFFGHSELHPALLNNALTLGGTGSGKTHSVVMPLLAALLNYQLHNGSCAAVLVIDPKRELEEQVRRTLAQRGESDRLVVIGECAPVPLFAADCPLSASDRLVKLQTFGPSDQTNGDHAYWRNLGLAMLLDILQLELDFAAKTGGRRLMALLAEELQLTRAKGVCFWSSLRDVLAYTRASRNKLKEADGLLRKICRLACVISSSVQVMEVYTGDEELLRQWCYAVQSAEPLINALANPDIERFVDLDPVQDNGRAHTDIASLLAQGKIVLFCPEPREGHRIAGKAVKQKFFEAVFSREDLEKPIGVVIDEAQRFITDDAETGEQAFLDRCRAYRAIVVMATQSIASLKHALGSNATAQTALDIISANTPTKFILRSTDVDTVTWLRNQLPQSGDDSPHIIDIRRPSNLKPGEAYFMLADGSWGRRRARLQSLA